MCHSKLRLPSHILTGGHDIFSVTIWKLHVSVRALQAADVWRVDVIARLLRITDIDRLFVCRLMQQVNGVHHKGRQVCLNGTL